MGVKGERVIAFAGNPNVGKSTLFNALTGMKQHTGNWPGKTVETAWGQCRVQDAVLSLVDLPGTYSLFAHSKEEEAARDFICSGEADGVVVVCDAGCLERNLNLALQVAEMTPHVLLCLNLMDEAEKKGIRVDIEELSRCLSIPVVATDARKKESIALLRRSLRMPFSESCARITYPEPLESAVEELSAVLAGANCRWRARRMLYGEETPEGEEAREILNKWQEIIGKLPKEEWEDMAANGVVQTAHDLCAKILQQDGEYGTVDRRIDRFLTGKVTGFFSMLLLLGLILWITIVGANSLSDGLMRLFSRAEALLRRNLTFLPPLLQGILMDGVYRVVSWVVAVMLPPMAIFFPMFTLLEDSGVLPRIAYNLDKPFQCCAACGKQALCMCMGLGCNAVGVTGCRIIDSPRERMLAILTNCFMPCNGRFPALFMLITVFLAGDSSILSAVMLTGVILLGVFMTFLATKLLSKTLLRGVPSSFTMELPSYRMPRVGQVILRSMWERTAFVLLRAAEAAIPAGVLIYLLGNYPGQDRSYLTMLAGFFDPVGRFLGLDGVILLAFLLGLPANEIVIPIILMVYTRAGSPVDYGSTAVIGRILQENGWTVQTAMCAISFFLMHWPCAATLMTIRKETGSRLWTATAMLIPTACGIVCCLAVRAIFTMLPVG